MERNTYYIQYSMQESLKAKTSSAAIGYGGAPSQHFLELACRSVERGD